MKAIALLFLGLGIGILIGAYMESMRPHEQVPITESIVLDIPKTDKDMEKQLLYLSASKGMLEELHRQKMMRR